MKEKLLKYTPFGLAGTIVAVLIIATIVGAVAGNDVAQESIYTSPFFIALWAATTITATIYFLHTPAKRVFLFMGSKSTKHATARNGELLTEVMLPLAKKARYIRVSVCDADGERASSRGYFPEEWG